MLTGLKETETLQVAPAARAMPAQVFAAITNSAVLTEAVSGAVAVPPVFLISNEVAAEVAFTLTVMKSVAFGVIVRLLGGITFAESIATAMPPVGLLAVS